MKQQLVPQPQLVVCWVTAPAGRHGNLQTATTHVNLRDWSLQVQLQTQTVDASADQIFVVLNKWTCHLGDLSEDKLLQTETCFELGTVWTFLCLDDPSENKRGSTQRTSCTSAALWFHSLFLSSPSLSWKLQMQVGNVPVCADTNFEWRLK